MPKHQKINLINQLIIIVLFFLQISNIMNRLINFKKVVGLIALLICGVWMAQAQSNGLAIDYSGQLADVCIYANEATPQRFDLVPPSGLTLANLKNIQWVAHGGIKIDYIDPSGYYVEILPENGTTYGTKFSKYGKGRLTVECDYDSTVILDWVFLTGNCSDGTTGTVTVNVTAGLPPYITHIGTYIDVCKIFTIPDGNVNDSIVGPVCVNQGETVTYSIAPWVTLSEPDKVGFDDYVWFPDGIIPSFVQNGVLYYSADKSSITFTVGQLTGSDVISVQVGKCNIPNNVLTLALRPAIQPPVIIPSSCIPGGVRNVTFNIQGANPNIEYKWMSDNWNLVSPDNIGDTKTYQTDNNGGANILVEANYINGTGCKSVFSTTKITRSFSSRSQIVATSGGNCLEADESVRFYVSDAPTPATFSWNYESLTDWAFAEVEVTDDGADITLIPGYNAVSGEKLRVTLNNCNPSDPDSYREFEFNIKPGAATSITNQTTNSFCLTRGQLYTFSATSENPVPTDSYKWELGSGWEPVIGYGSTITAMPVGNVIADSIRVIPMGVNGCNGNSFAQTVSYPPTAPDGVTIDKECINSGMADTITLSVGGTVNNNQSYYWDVPSGLGTIIGDDTGSSISVKTKGYDGDFEVYVRAFTNNSVCQYSDPDSITVSIQRENFSVSEINDGGDYYYQLAPAKGFSIQWMLDGMDITDYAMPSTTDYTYSGLLESTSTRDFHVTATKTTTGCKTRVGYGTHDIEESDSDSSSGLRSAKTQSTGIQSVSKSSKPTMTVSPNPANNNITVSMSEAGNVDIQIYSMNGGLIRTFENKPEISNIDVSGFISGSYVLLATQNNKLFRQIIIIN